MRSFGVPHSAECHLLGPASGSLFPGKEQSGVGVRYVRLAVDAQLACRPVNPPGRPFDLGKKTDGRFIKNHVARAVAPLGAKFFVPEGRNEAQRPQDLFKLFTIVKPGFSLHPDLVPGRFAFGLVGQQPTGPVLAQAQQLASFPQGLAGKVEKSVAFVRTRRHLTKRCRSQPPREFADVVHTKLDFNFLGHASRQLHEPVGADFLICRAEQVSANLRSRQKAVDLRSTGQMGTPALTCSVPPSDSRKCWQLH